MQQPTKLSRMTVEEYLAAEEVATIRHEYVDGRVFAMTGGTHRHNIIIGNLFSILRQHVRGSRCRAYFTDIKVRVEATNSFYYPDLLVACGTYDQDSCVVEDPVLIVEVLSRSTAAIDRREKVIAYRQIASLNEYVVVYQSKPFVELHKRNVDGQFDLFEYGRGSELVLESIPVGSLKLLLAQIYEDVDFGRLTVSEEHADYEAVVDVEVGGDMDSDVDTNVDMLDW